MSTTRRFGQFEVDLRAGELRRQGVRIRLEDQPFQILALLLERPGDLVAREELRNRLWPAQTYVDFDRRLNVAMARLRSVLGDSRENPRYIETLYRRGYRFLAPVSAGGPPASVPASPPASRSLPEPPPPAWGRTRPVALLALIALLSGLSIASRHIFEAAPARAMPPVARPRTSIAVLGIKDLSGRPGHAWLSTALSEWLTTELAAGEHVRTIPPQSVARMELERLPRPIGTTSDELRKIGRHLGTELMVVGSYAVVGMPPQETIRVDLRILETRTGETVAVLSETGVESDLLALVSKAGAQLRTKLGVPAITRQQAVALTAAMPADPRAARLYSEGVARLRVFDALAARDRLQKAVTVEPGYALAHAALATAWAELGYDRNARECAQRAYALSHDLPRTEHLLIKARHHATARDWSAAEDVYRALFQFFPDDLDHGLALLDVQLSANRWHEALATVAALREQPAPASEDPRIDLAESIAARSLGQIPRAHAAGARAVDRARALGASLTLAKARLEQAWELQGSGETRAADEAAREAEEIYRAAGYRAGAARAGSIRATVALRSSGDSVRAKRIYEETLAHYREIGHQRGVGAAHVNLGVVLKDLGDVRSAHRNFEAALAAFSEVDDRGGVTVAKINLGDALLLLGDPAAAKALLDEALDGARQAGDRSRVAAVSLSLARVLALEGQVDEARESALRALAIYREIGSSSDAALAEIVMAEILTEHGLDAEAEARARHAVDVLGRERRELVERRAHAVSARALVAQGRLDDARRALAKAEAPGGFQTREIAFDLTITSARLAAADPKVESLATARGRLQQVVDAAEGAGCARCAFDARFALAEIDIQSGAASAERRLQDLEQEALRRGFRSVGLRAAAVLERTRTERR